MKKILLFSMIILFSLQGFTADNIKYSYKSLKRKSFISIPVKEFDSSEIIGTSFYQNEPFTSDFNLLPGSPCINTGLGQ